MTDDFISLSKRLSFLSTENLDSILFTKNKSEVKKNKFDLYIGGEMWDCQIKM